MATNNTNKPLWVIRPSTLEKLSIQMQAEKLLLSETGNLRDWRGVVELAGLSQQFEGIKQTEKPFNELFRLWKKQPGTTVENLHSVLMQVDRFDVWDDNLEFILEDIKIAEKTAASKGLDISRLNHTELASSGEALTYEDLRCLSLGRELPKYDAFVLYGENEESFVMDVLVPNLEAQGLQVLLKERDLLGGAFEHAAVTSLISGRCAKLIPVFSESFFNSEYNTFLANFAQHRSFEQVSDKKKIIPLVYDSPESIPANLSIYHKLPYAPWEKKHVWFWKKLCGAIHPTGCFDPNIPMLDMEQGTPDIPVTNDSKSNHVNTPEVISPNRDLNQTNLGVTSQSPTLSHDRKTELNEDTTPEKAKRQKIGSKLKLPFSKKNDKSKSDKQFQNLCEEPETPEEEGINESGELLLPSVPKHEPGVLEKLKEKMTPKSSSKTKARKYGSKQAESSA